MKDPGCGPEAWAVLDGRLWHATSVDAVRGIQQDGFITPGNRYRGSFVSARGWVSLFDFGPSARDEWNQWHNWAQWFGATHDADLSAWLEIDREAGEKDIVDAEALRVLWNQEVDRRVGLGSGEPWQGTIIPGVEAGYRGKFADGTRDASSSHASRLFRGRGLGCAGEHRRADIGHAA